MLITLEPRQAESSFSWMCSVNESSLHEKFSEWDMWCIETTAPYFVETNRCTKKDIFCHFVAFSLPQLLQAFLVVDIKIETRSLQWVLHSAELHFCREHTWKAAPDTDCVMNCCLSKSHTNYTQIALAQIEWKDAAQIRPVLLCTAHKSGQHVLCHTEQRRLSAAEWISLSSQAAIRREKSVNIQQSHSTAACYCQHISSLYLSLIMCLRPPFRCQTCRWSIFNKG